jgi:hypothetical protein
MGIFLDLTNVSDVTNVAYLEQYGLRGKVHSWMGSHLTGRTQFVKIQQSDEMTSNIKILTLSHKEIKYAVSKGSVLGFFPANKSRQSAHRWW